MKTFTAWPTHFFRSTSCCSSSVLQLLARTQWKLPWYVWLCFYCALLVVLEEWRNEGETNILQCDNAQPDATKNSFNTSSIWVRWFCHCLSHVLKWCPTHGGPALSFFLECNWIWVEVILMIFSFADKRPHTWKALLLSHKVVVSSVSAAWFQMATLCRTSPEDGQRYNVRMCVDSHAAVPRAKVTNLLSKSLANLDPPSAQQT